MHSHVFYRVSYKQVGPLEHSVIFLDFDCVLNVNQNADDIKLLADDSSFDAVSQSDGGVLIFGDAVGVRDFLELGEGCEDQFVGGDFFVFRVVIGLFPDLGLGYFVDSVFNQIVFKLLGGFSKECS